MRLTPASSVSRQQLRFAAAGVIDEPFSPALTTTSTALTSQRVYGTLLGCRAGDTVAGCVLRIQTAAAGTNPTLAKFGLADSTGKILVLSNDLGAAANWTVGAPTFAFTAPYTVTADGGYYACFVVNGTWGTTQPALDAISGLVTTAGSAVSGAAQPFFTWDSQTDLPGVGSSLTISASASNRYIALYGTSV